MRRFTFILLFVLSYLHCVSQCIHSPDSIQWLSRKTRLDRYCGDINAYSKQGLTILMGACYYGKNLTLIEQCLKRKPDIFKPATWISDSAKTEFYSEFNSCSFITFPSHVEPGIEDVKSEYDEMKILKLFLKYYPHDSAKIFYYAFESLMRYDFYCTHKSLYSYLSSNISLNNIDSGGNSYLHIAIKYGRTDVAIWLCRQGLSLEQRNKNGETPLSFVSKYIEASKQEALIAELKACDPLSDCPVCH